MRWILRCLLATAVVLLGLEVVLRITEIRSGGSDRGAAVILCVGDSFTFGSGVQVDEAYPAELQRRLDRDTPGRYRVVNLGVGGWNTTQVLLRLRDQVRRHDPALLLVTAGVNDYWNLGEVERRPSEWSLRLDSMLMASHLYRAARRGLARGRHRADLEAEPSARPRLIPLEGDRWGVVIDGSIVEFVVRKRDWGVDPASTDRVTRDLESIARWAGSAGVPTAFITYFGGDTDAPISADDEPARVAAYAAAGQAIRTAAAETGARVIDLQDAIDRVPESERVWVAAGHPGPRIYAELADDVAKLVVATVGADSR